MPRIQNEEAYGRTASEVLKGLFGGGRFIDREVIRAVHDNSLTELFTEKGISPRGQRIALDRIERAVLAL